MARVTVEDCVQQIPNRFELVVLAAQRARDISAGSPLTVDRDRDKNPVVSLREIADKNLDLAALHHSVVFGLQKHVEADDAEDEAELYEGETLLPPDSDPIPVRTSTIEEDDVGGEDLDLDALARDLKAEADGFRHRDGG